MGEAFKDLVRSFSPNKGFGLLVIEVKKLFNGLLQSASADKAAATNSLVAEQREPALHQIEPGCSGGCEVHLETRMARQPAANRRSFVRAVVVQDEVNVQFGGHIGMDRLQKFSELDGTVAAMTLPDHLARLSIQSGKQRCSSVADIVMRVPLHLSWTHGK